MRPLPLLLLLGACGGPSLPPPANDAAPAREATIANTVVQPVANEEPAPDLPGDDALADMSPRQRRAYELGFRDCSAGRYDPDPHPEAYRIGCGGRREESRRPLAAIRALPSHRLRA